MFAARLKIAAALALAVAPICAASASSYVSIETASDISEAVNRKMVFVPEAPGLDDWQEGKPSGDCEDFVLTKRAALIAAGMPADRIRVLILRNKSEGHAVLAVRFARMFFVFDRYSVFFPSVSASGFHGPGHENEVRSCGECLMAG